MAYVKNTWATGDVVTSSKLNNIENGIADGGVLSVTGTLSDSTLTLDKTYNEIINATDVVISVDMEGVIYRFVIVQVMDHGHSKEFVAFSYNGDESAPFAYTFVANSGDDYPSATLE